MNVRAAGGAVEGGPDYAPAEQIVGIHGRVALLMLEAQQKSEEAEQEARDVARESYESALADEVSSMHEAADAAFWGAVVQGAVSSAAGALSMSGALSRDVPALSDQPSCREKLLFEQALQKTDSEITGDALQQMSAPVGKLVGSGEGHRMAEAKAHGGRAEIARWAMSDAGDAIRQSRELTQKTVDWAESLSEKDAATTTAILSNMA